ncbi:MAG: Mn-Zn_transporter_SitD, partial [uncultured Phycisphaerae bacterium]
AGRSRPHQPLRLDPRQPAGRVGTGAGDVLADPRRGDAGLGGPRAGRVLARRPRAVPARRRAGPLGAAGDRDRVPDRPVAPVGLDPGRGDRDGHGGGRARAGRPGQQPGEGGRVARDRVHHPVRARRGADQPVRQRDRPGPRVRAVRAARVLHAGPVDEGAADGRHPGRRRRADGRVLPAPAGQHVRPAAGPEHGRAGRGRPLRGDGRAVADDGGQLRGGRGDPGRRAAGHAGQHRPALDRPDAGPAAAVGRPRGAGDCDRVLAEPPGDPEHVEQRGDLGRRVRAVPGELAAR